MKRCPVCSSRHNARDWTCPNCGAFPESVDGVLTFGVGQGTATLVHDAEYLRERLVDAEQWHFWFQARRRLVLWAIERFFAGSSSLLDIGCGTGFILEGIRARHPGMALAGCDVSRDALMLTRERMPDAFVFQALAARLPFEREFDVVTALDVLEHIDDDREALTAVLRAVRPGGGVVLTVPQHRWLWSAVDDFSCHRRRYTRADLVEKIRTSGFEVCRATSCFATTLPLVIGSRFRSALGTFDPARELQIPRTLNSLLNGLVECEWMAIRLGVSLPVGGSLLIVARRPRA